jgi:choline dehydrogenase-like flavoprotein
MYSDVDREHVKRIYAAMKNMLTSEGFKIENEANLDDLDFSQAFHPSSTIKMHKDPEHGVVNCFGIMHSHPRILIASAAVFPKPGWVNPSFLIMCLSSMGVRKILENA